MSADPWKPVTILFLPSQYESFELLLDHLEGRAELVGTAPLELEPEFNKAVQDFALIKNVRSVGTAVAVLTQMANDWIAMNDSEHDPSQPWVRLDSVFGTDAVPAAVGRVIREAIEVAATRDEINPEHPWQILEWWAATYLATA